MNKDLREEINRNLGNWRQGDVALGCGLGFTHFADLTRPHTEASVKEAKLLKEAGHVLSSAPSPVADVTVHGVAVTSQTCDVVRDCVERPYVVVSPLVRVESAEIVRDVQYWRRPRFGWIASIAGDLLVVDLDRAETVEKAVAAGWDRTPGWNRPEELRIFVKALERNVRRVAFSDGFLSATRKIVRHVKSNHGKDSAEGRLLERLQEIRVRASPAREAGKIKIDWWFIIDSYSRAERKMWSCCIQKWLAKVDTKSAFVLGKRKVCDMSGITAKNYWTSDQMDFDSLSNEQQTEGSDRN